MELTIEHKEENKLLSRLEVKARMSFEGAIPARKNVRKAIADKLKAKEDLIIIKKIQPKFGEQAAIVSAYVFESEEALKKISSKAILKRHGLVEEKKEEAA